MTQRLAFGLSLHQAGPAAVGNCVTLERAEKEHNWTISMEVIHHMLSGEVPAPSAMPRSWLGGAAGHHGLLNQSQGEMRRGMG